MHNASGLRTAIKIYEKARLGLRIKQVQREICILRKLDHPNLPKLYDVIDNQLMLYLIMEHVPGANLATQLSSNFVLLPTDKSQSYSELKTKHLIK